jgi:hypothetical protein
MCVKAVPETFTNSTSFTYMLEKFPRLFDAEVALARAEHNTGIVVDESLFTAINRSQRVFTVYPNVKDALLAAIIIVKNQPHVECLIQNDHKAVLQHIHAILFSVLSKVKSSVGWL